MTAIIRSAKNPIAINGLRAYNIDVVSEDVTILIFLSPQHYPDSCNWVVRSIILQL